jgi:hypothetical protein
MRISLIHAAFENSPTVVAEFIYHHVTDSLAGLEIIYRETQNLSREGWLWDRRGCSW